MTDTQQIRSAADRHLAWPLRLTRAGMVAERVTRAFWPVWSILFVGLGALMLGLHTLLPIEVVWGSAVLCALGTLGFALRGAFRFRWPSRAEALERLDRTLPGRPIAALSDTQVIGAGDAASAAVWQAHVARMAARVEQARAVSPDLRMAARDPFALRYVALLVLVMALGFGSIWRVSSVTELAPGNAALAAGPSWEGWVEPPAYTGKPSLYLNDIAAGELAVPEASRVTLRFYGEVGALTLSETVSARIGELPPASDPEQSFEIRQPGEIVIDGAGGRSWTVAVTPDATPQVRLDGPAERSPTGEMRLPFAASDDYGVVSGQVEFALDLDAVDRRHGLAVLPEERETLVLDLPMPIAGDRREFAETLVDDLSQHPWVGLPVRVTFTVADDLGQEGRSTPETMDLPGRRFFDTLANAIIEQRRDLLWSRENGPRVAQILRAISHRPEDAFDSETAYLKLRVALRRLEVGNEFGLSLERRDEVAEALWDVAVMIEDGTLSNALARLREAQERLAEAMRNGASDEEIAELMQELREAMQEYMRQLAQQQQQDGQEQAEAPPSQTITGDQLEQMLQRLQELMEQGRMDEAQQLLDQLSRMMENMRITEGQQGQQSPGQQAMEGLSEMLRDQQELSDETFGDLQDQFQQPGQQGEQGQQGQQGEQGQQGQGQGQMPGQGQSGTQPGDGGQQSLADRQRALRQELQRQQGSLPGAGTPEGDAARDALDRAGRAMDDAEDALREDDFAGALDSQAEAMEALREGMRELGEAMAQQQQQNGQQGDANGQANNSQRRDPLGRDVGANGQIGTDEQLLQGEDVYRRARELLDEIRRRSSDQERPDQELEYLKRLLDRF
ncbi:MAG: TIGR02302 family protein [Paracoccaceae bacterium]